MFKLAGEGGHKTTPLSPGCVLTVAGGHHLPVSAGWVLIDSYQTLSSRDRLCSRGQRQRTGLFFLLYLMLLLITEIRLKQLQQLIKEQCGFWHLGTDGTAGNS